MIPTNNKLFRTLKLSNLENFRALKLSDFIILYLVDFNMFKFIKFLIRTEKSPNLENFRALKLSELENFRPLNARANASSKLQSS